MEIRPDDIMGLLCCTRDMARQQFAFFGNKWSSKRKWDNRIVGMLGFKMGKINSASVESGWRSGLKHQYFKTKITDGLGQTGGRLFTDTASCSDLRAYVDASV